MKDKSRGGLGKLWKPRCICLQLITQDDPKIPTERLLSEIHDTYDFFPDDYIYKIEDPATEEERLFCQMKSGPFCFPVLQDTNECVTKVGLPGYIASYSWKKKPCQLIAGTGWQDKPRRSILFPQGDKVGRREVYCSEYDVQDEKTYGYYLMELFQYGCSPLDSCLFCHSNFIHGEQVVANRLRLLYCIVEVKNTKNTF